MKDSERRNRIIPLTSTQARPAPYGEPGLDIPRVLPMDAAPAASSAPKLLPMDAAPPANRFGSSQRFQESLDRNRALKQNRAGSFAMMKAQGVQDREAGQMAYAQSQLAAADLGTNNAFLNRGLAIDENNRQNQVADAYAKMLPIGAGMEASQRQAGIDKTRAETANIQARAQTYPADAAAKQATAAKTQFEMERSRTLLPMDAMAKQASAARAYYGLPLDLQHVQAQTDQLHAQTAAAPINAQAAMQRSGQHQFTPRTGADLATAYGMVLKQSGEAAAKQWLARTVGVPGSPGQQSPPTVPPTTPPTSQAPAPGAPQQQGQQQPGGRQVVRTGMYEGRRVAEYSDGTIDFVN